MLRLLVQGFRICGLLVEGFGSLVGFQGFWFRVELGGALSVSDAYP